MILCICGSIKIKDKEWIFNRIDEFASTLEKSEKITKKELADLKKRQDEQCN